MTFAMIPICVTYVYWTIEVWVRKCLVLNITISTVHAEPSFWYLLPSTQCAEPGTEGQSHWYDFTL